MRHALPQVLLPAAVAIMMSVGIVMASFAPVDSAGAGAMTANSTRDSLSAPRASPVAHWVLREQSIGLGSGRVDSPRAVAHTQQEPSVQRASMSGCDHLTTAAQPAPSLREPCCGAFAETVPPAALAVLQGRPGA